MANQHLWEHKGSDQRKMKTKYDKTIDITKYYYASDNRGLSFSKQHTATNKLNELQMGRIVSVQISRASVT